MKLIKKYQLGDKLFLEDLYWEENPLYLLYSNTDPHQFYKSLIENMQEIGKFYKRNPSARGAAGGNSKANIEYANGKNSGYWNNPQVRPNAGDNWRNTIAQELDKFLGIPYNFGGKEKTYKSGRTVDVGGEHPERKYSGVDCSGFTAWFAKEYLGMPLSEGAANEYKELVEKTGHNIIVKKNGKLKNPVINEETVLPGDVVFFGDKGVGGNHIGIVHHVENGKIYLTNAKGGNTAKIVTCPIDDMVESHANVYITSLRSDRNYNLNGLNFNNIGLNIILKGKLIADGVSDWWNNTVLQKNKNLKNNR